MSCPDCFTGSLHSGTPSGKVTTIHELPTYVAEPPSGTAAKGIVVIIPDVFGWEMPNARLLADAYAKQGGYRVLLPDFMAGQAIAGHVMSSIETAMDSSASIFSRLPAGITTLLNAAPFMITQRFSVTTPRVYSFFRSLRATTSLPIGAAGFCWGGYFTIRMCAGLERTDDGRPLIDAGFTAHPSGFAIPGDIEPVKLPLSIAHATADFSLSKDKVDTIKSLFEGKRKEGVQVELVEYEDAKHGFATRGQEEVEREMRQMKEAKDQAVNWFEKFLVMEKGKR